MTAKDPPKEETEKVGKAVRERRESLGLSQDLSPYGGPKRNLVGGLETRGIWPRMPATRARWARALQWAPDAFDKLLAGEEPKELESAFPGGTRAATEISRRVVENARSGLPNNYPFPDAPRQLVVSTEDLQHLDRKLSTLLDDVDRIRRAVTDLRLECFSIGSYYGRGGLGRD